MSFSSARSNIFPNAAHISVSVDAASTTSNSPPDHYDMRPNSQDGGHTVRKLPRTRSDLDFIDFVRDIVDRADADNHYASISKKPGAPQMLDLTQRNAKRLPLEVIDLIKDHTIRYVSLISIESC